MAPLILPSRQSTVIDGATLPKTRLCTVFYSVFTFCEAETTANIDVFELAVAKSTTFYHMFQCVYALRG